MLRFLIRGTPLKRFANGIPIVGILLAAEVAAMAWTHLGRLTGVQRRRLLGLLVRTRGWRSVRATWRAAWSRS